MCCHESCTKTTQSGTAWMGVINTYNNVWYEWYRTMSLLDIVPHFWNILSEVLLFCFRFWLLWLLFPITMILYFLGVFKHCLYYLPVFITSVCNLSRVSCKLPLVCAINCDSARLPESTAIIQTIAAPRLQPDLWTLYLCLHIQCFSIFMHQKWPTGTNSITVKLIYTKQNANCTWDHIHHIHTDILTCLLPFFFLHTRLSWVGM